MAFTINTFQFGRGVATCPTNGAGVSTVTHGYKTEDTLADVLVANYFPAAIDGAPDKVFVKDTLLIVTSDTVVEVLITSLDPFEFGADLFGGSGSPIVMNIPVAATDANGIKITGSIVQLEIADSTHPGIITELNQTLAGIKTFNSGVKFLTFGGTPSTLNDYQVYSHVTTFTNNTETTAAVTLKLVRNGDGIILRNTTLASTPGQGAPLARFTADTVLPAYFRPSVACSGHWRVSNGGVFSSGAILIDTTGDIYIYNNDDFTTAFTAAQINGFYTNTFSYTI
jgi:hypothetical protein